MNYVYIVIANYGFYMEPDIEIIEVFENLKSAKKKVLELKNKEKKYSNYSHNHFWYIKKKLKK